MVKYFINNNYLLEYGFSLVLTNIVIYLVLLTLVFGTLFLFNINNLQALSDIKLLNNFSFPAMLLIITLLSLAGVPPLVGFVGKFLLLVTIIINNN